MRLRVPVARVLLSGSRESERAKTELQPQKIRRFRTRPVVAVSAAHLIHDIHSAFLAPLLPLLIDRLGLSLAAAGWLEVARRSPALLNPVVGLLADRMCVKYLVIFAPAVTAVTMCLLGVAPSFPVLMALLLIGGLSAVVFHVPAPVLIKHFSGDRTGRGMSFFMFGGEMARTLGPLLITSVVATRGLGGSVLLLPLGLTATLALWLLLRHLEPPPRNGRESMAGTVAGARRHAPLLIGIGGFMLLRQGIKMALTLYLPTYLTSRGETLWVGGLALALLQFAGAAATFAVGYLADHFGHRRTLAAIGVLTPVATVALAFAGGWVLAPLLLVSGFLIFASGPIVLALVQDAGSDHPAFMNSLFMTLNWLTSAGMILVVGSLGDRIGLEATYRVTAALSLLAVPFLFLLRPGPQAGPTTRSP